MSKQKDNRKKSVAEVYHQETKYHEREMFRYQKTLDFSRQPSPYKICQTEKKIALGTYLTNPIQKKMVPALSTVSQLGSKTEIEQTPFRIETLSHLLYLTNGITGIVRYPNGQSTALRASPSAGGLYPTEIYLAIRSVGGMEDGIYNFQVEDNSLVLIWEGDYWTALTKGCMEHEAIAHSNLLMILTAVYERSTWRYADRGYRRILLDTGHLLGNLMVCAPEQGFVPYPIGGFFDPSLTSLLFLDPSKEGVLTVVALPQYGAMGLEPCVKSAIASHSLTLVATDKTERVLQLHAASSILNNRETADPSLDRSQPSEPNQSEISPIIKEEVILASSPLLWPAGASDTIQERRSTRRFTGEPYLQEELASILEYGYQSTVEKPAQFFTPSLLTTYLVVQKVIGLPAGIYIYDPKKKAVACLKTGVFEHATYHFCLGQDLAKDAAALVIHTAHFQTALDQYGDRAYRYLHLDAGHIGERINLAAIHMGLGVSGIAGFYDDEVNTLLDCSLDTIIVYITVLGRA